VVICHDETVKVACKNCDELINCIDRVSVPNRIDQGLSSAMELSP
jgi:hypothetical protein